MQQQKAIETLKHLGAACVALAELMEEAGPSESVKPEESKPEPKPKKEKAQKVAKEEKPVAEAEPSEEVKEMLPEISEDQLRTALVDYAQRNSKEKAYAVLGKYGAKKVNELKKSDFPKVLQELQ